MIEECKIEKNSFRENRKDFSYQPKNKKYKSLQIYGWSHYNVPIGYELVNDEDVLLHFKGRIVPLLFQKKYLDTLKDYLLNDYDRCSIILKEIKQGNNTVGEHLGDIGVNYLRIAWSSSRTIERAFNRQALAYAKAFCGLVVIFKKRGGYLAYSIGTMGLGNKYVWSTATQIDLLNCIELIKDIREKNMGKVYLPDDLEDEIREHIMIERL